jgi:chemotaxis signal transduction protein
MHALVIPTQRESLLVPSAMTAEILTVPPMTQQPFAERWLLGIAVWRRRAVPVVSFEVLLGSDKVMRPHGRSKLVVFQPLKGRGEWDFFAVLASADPHPYTVTSALDLVPTDSALSRNPYVSATVKIGSSAVVIPDTVVLSNLFYASR